jgi:hypothetical protein
MAVVRVQDRSDAPTFSAETIGCHTNPPAGVRLFLRFTQLPREIAGQIYFGLYLRIIYEGY